MAWEWVAPSATAIAGATGIFFTWLTGHQSRKQAERLAARNEQTLLEKDRLQQRKDAYLAALRCVRIDLQRLKYLEKGEDTKLSELERKWSKAERLSMGIEAITAVEAFGTERAAAAAQDILDALATKDRTKLKISYGRFLGVIRQDLGIFGHALSQEGVTEEDPLRETVVGAEVNSYDGHRRSAGSSPVADTPCR